MDLLAFATAIYAKIGVLSKENPIVAGAISLWGLTVITFLCKDVPARVKNFLSAFFTTSITIDSNDMMYAMILRWLPKQKSWAFNQTLRVSNSAWGKAGISFGYGKRFIFYKGRIISFTRQEKNKEGAAGGYEGRITSEFLTLTKFGRSGQFFTQLFEIVMDEEVKSSDESSTIEVQTWSLGWEWGEASKRSLDSIYIPKAQKARIINHVDSFLKEKDWYMKRGIPWKTGILLKGPSGTGKTSLVRALATHYGSTVWMLSLNSISDSTLAQALERVQPDDAPAFVLIEDIDAFNINLNRETQPTGESEGAAKMLTISGLLNAFDGIKSKDNVIFIATTNHPERLDPALIRSGRFDLHETIDYLTDEVFKEYLSTLYPNKDFSQYRVKPNIAISSIFPYALRNKEDPSDILDLFAEKIS